MTGPRALALATRDFFTGTRGARAGRRSSGSNGVIFLGGDCVRGESAGGGSGEPSCVTAECPDRNTAVRRQRKALMVHQAEDPAEEFAHDIYSIGNGVI